MGHAAGPTMFFDGHLIYKVLDVYLDRSSGGQVRVSWDCKRILTFYDMKWLIVQSCSKKNDFPPEIIPSLDDFRSKHRQSAAQLQELHSKTGVEPQRWM